jgi:hypothetical protein
MVIRSSNTSQPSAALPGGRCRSSAPASMRIATTVEAIASARPKTRPAPRPQPASQATRSPAPVETVTCTSAPGTTTRRTASSSSRWNCRPTPNIRSTTPSSENCCAISPRATKPGVNGPTAMPASR